MARLVGFQMCCRRVTRPSIWVPTPSHTALTKAVSRVSAGQGGAQPPSLFLFRYEVPSRITSAAQTESWRVKTIPGVITF
jgi:hypothetical protein